MYFPSASDGREKTQSDLATILYNRRKVPFSKTYVGTYSYLL